MSKVLVLKTISKNKTSFGGFVWPEKGLVECPDWKPTKKCGNGFHALLWGEGESRHLTRDDALWVVCSVDESDIINLGNKIKFKKGRVIHLGDKEKAIEIICKANPYAACFGAEKTGGNYSIVVTGNYGTSFSGQYGQAIAGKHGTARSLNHGFSKTSFRGWSRADDYGHALSGNEGISFVGIKGTAISGDRGLSVGFLGVGHSCCKVYSGTCGIAVAGYYSEAEAGLIAISGQGGTSRLNYENFHGGMASVGENGKIIANSSSYIRAGKGSVIFLEENLTNKKSESYICKTLFVGKDLESNVPYHNERGKLIRISEDDWINLIREKTAYHRKEIQDFFFQEEKKVITSSILKAA